MRITQVNFAIQNFGESESMLQKILDIQFEKAKIPFNIQNDILFLLGVP